MEAEHNKYFSSIGFSAASFFNLTPSEAFSEAKNNAVMVDVREEELTGFKCFDVPKVIYVPLSQINLLYSQLPKDIPIIIADSVGLRSKEAMIFLINKGFKNIANLAGGIVEWERDGLPLKIDNSEKLDGSCMCQLKPRNKLKNK